MSDDIKWNKQKAQERADERHRKKARAHVGKMYQDWKKILCSQPRTPQEVVASLYKLKDEIMDYLHSEGLATMKDFHDFTCNLVEDCIARAITSQMSGSNVITPAEIEGVDIPTHLKPKPAQFKTIAEFLSIPWIVRYRNNSGFVGFLRQGRIIHALYSDNMAQHTGVPDLPVVGTVSNTVGLDQLPSPETFFTELGKKAKPGNN